MKDIEAPLTVGELAESLEDHPLDCTMNSKQLIRKYGKLFQLYVPTATLVLSALLTGHAVVAHPDDRCIFQFCKVQP